MTATVTLRRPHPRQLQFVESKAKRIIIRAGRRGGKTTGISIRAVQRFLDGRRVLYAAPTQDQTERFWFEVTQALAEPIAAGYFVKNESSRVIERKGTEQRIRATTAWNADTMRGDYGDEVILDEFELMSEEVWTKVVAPMMLDKDGTTVFIYTPPSAENAARSKARDPMYAAKLFERARADDGGRWATFTFTSHDNPHLSKVALEEITLDMDERSYRQEILAEDIWETPGALWSQGEIDKWRLEGGPAFYEVIVIGVDPSKSSKPGSDECGVSVCGRDDMGLSYLMADLSEVAPPERWGATVAEAARMYREMAHEVVIVAEDNAGGEMIRTVLHAADPSLLVGLIPAVQNKYLRAQPVRARWGRGECRVIGRHERLEYQMCNWLDGAAWSPDRMDAMVHAMRRLMLSHRVALVGSVDL